MRIVFHVISQGKLKKGQLELHPNKPLSLKKVLHIIQQTYGIKMPRMSRNIGDHYTILCNGDLIHPETYRTTFLTDSDELTILSQLVGG